LIALVDSPFLAHVSKNHVAKRHRAKGHKILIGRSPQLPQFAYLEVSEEILSGIKFFNVLSRRFLEIVILTTIHLL